MGNQTRDLRPVPRHKPNRNKVLSVPPKMGTNQTPANAPVSCVWRGNCRRRGLKGAAPRNSDRDAPGELQIWCSRYVSVLGDVKTPGVLDSRPTISIEAKKKLPRGDRKNITPTAAIRMGDGHVVHTCGDCEIKMPTGSRSIAHRFYVMDTDTLDFVLEPTSSSNTPRFYPLHCKRPTSSKTKSGPW